MWSVDNLQDTSEVSYIIETAGSVSVYDLAGDISSELELLSSTISDSIGRHVKTYFLAVNTGTAETIIKFSYTGARYLSVFIGVLACMLLLWL